ncbi:hypothetical protein FRC07_013737, partial [Ceratobasidium sp. 392]
SIHTLLESQDALVREASLALPNSFSQCTYDLGQDWFHESCLNLRDRVAPRVLDEPKDEREMKSEAEAGPKQEPKQEAGSKQEAETKQEPKPEPSSSALPPNFDAPQPVPTGAPAFASQAVPAGAPIIQPVPTAAPATTTNQPIAQNANQPNTQNAQNEDDDASSIASDPDLPPALIKGDTYDVLICGQCVLRNPTVRRYAGSVGYRMVVPDGEGWRILGQERGEDMEVEVVKKEEDEGMKEEEGGAGTKRRATDDADQPVKRARPESKCLAPLVNDEAQKILDDLDKLSIKSEEGEEVKSGPGRVRRALGDVFLSAGWRERWCRCATCDPPLLLHPHLLHEEETYEPPADPDAALSLEELGMRALESLPHERALDSIRAYNSMRDDLMLYLRPFAESGREVREEDITAFFAERRART